VCNTAAAAAAAAGLEGELRLVHPRVSAPVAEALGVASRRRLMLAASADCLALGLAGAGGAVEAFGQSEALTTRLRHIIQVGRKGLLLQLLGAHSITYACTGLSLQEGMFTCHLCSVHLRDIRCGALICFCGCCLHFHWGPIVLLYAVQGMA
jgi:hypothetical protein